MKTRYAVLSAALVLCLVSACASSSSPSAPGGSGVTVFGTIDASVTHSTTKSGPAR